MFIKDGRNLGKDFRELDGTLFVKAEWEGFGE